MPLALRCRGCGALNPAGTRVDDRGEPVPIRWTGPCPSCGKRYNVERWRPSAFGAGGQAAFDPDGAISLRDVPKQELERIATWIEGLDYILGGEEGKRGIVPGSAILICGPPGCGKSTLLMMAMFALAKQHLTVLYGAGEQSLGELRTLADRVGKIPPALKVVAKGHVDELIEIAERVRPAAMVIDSVQTVSATDPNGSECRAGSNAAIDIAGNALRNYCKANGIALIFIGQVTKDDEVAGPRRLEHLVDVNLFFEMNEAGERWLGSDKNRLGRAPLRTRFLMGDKGLIDCYKVDRERAEAERAANEMSAVIAASIPDGETVNPLAWTAPDGTTALTVLAVACDEPECKGSIDRGCTAENGAREVGFHPSRVEKGKAHKHGRVLSLVREEDETEIGDDN